MYWFENIDFKMNLPPCSIFNRFSRLNFAPKAIPSSSAEAPLLHAEEHPPWLDHHHQGQQLGAQHLTCLRGSTNRSSPTKVQLKPGLIGLLS